MLPDIYMIKVYVFGDEGGTRGRVGIRRDTTTMEGLLWKLCRLVGTDDASKLLRSIA